MEFSGKPFSFYWEKINLPFFVLLAWSIAALIVAFVSIETYSIIFSGVNNIIVQILVLAFVGYTMAEYKTTSCSQCAWGGALTGVLAGFVGAVVSLILIYTAPQILNQAITQATAQGADAGMVEVFARIGAWVGLITGPLIAGLLGGLIAWLAGLVTKKMMK